ncbi:Ig-like domain-containing protein [Listeria kieliensis]|uniref:Gram-positive cocci surface proteins LPxTG domain-containing protein n=1 Tax=Listeria kieliensis TaxID=1621700 RepID=A0A3D8TQR6_9LIST|nr:Ig-like domain-containing protein [Listeria kieliensis]RDX01228.1 hypothetical protein UR08_09850 [Listeria kieliensis]
MKKSLARLSIVSLILTLVMSAVFPRGGEAEFQTNPRTTKQAQPAIENTVTPPILDKIRDDALYFSGRADPGKEVFILIARVDGLEIVARTKASSTGYFIVAIPNDLLPLTLYQKFYAAVMDASGGKYLSNKQLVQDTTPPEAKPLKQTFKQGSAVPKDPRQFLTDIYDNAGIGPENLTVTYDPEPDFSKPGAQEVGVRLTDKAGNQTLIRVPVEVTAYQTPVLNKIKDQDTAFTGQAEPGLTVSILDAKQQEVARAKADANGQFSVTIPTAKRPLTPYQAYVAVSIDDAGNKTPVSNKQLVQDTTPPEAKPLKQTFKQGEAAPKDPRQLLTDIYDNAGIGSENLTVTYETAPDFTELGAQVVTVKLTDKAGNQTLIGVPIEVVTRESCIGSSTGSENISAGTGGSQQLENHFFESENVIQVQKLASQPKSQWHIRERTLPSTGDRAMDGAVALGVFLLLATSTLWIYRRKQRKSMNE